MSLELIYIKKYCQIKDLSDVYRINIYLLSYYRQRIRNRQRQSRRRDRERLRAESKMKQPQFNDLWVRLEVARWDTNPRPQRGWFIVREGVIPQFGYIRDPSGMAHMTGLSHNPFKWLWGETGIHLNLVRTLVGLSGDGVTYET